MPRHTPLIIALSTVLLFAASAVNAQPQTVSYQGELKTNGQPFSGVANFKFAIVESSGTTLWSNDNTSSTGNEPTSSTPLNVDNGIFSVQLGDPSLGQTPISADGFALNGQPFLRIWVDTGSGFEQLSDAPISGTPYALVSDIASRALTDFDVPQTLTAGIVSTGEFAMQSGASAGYVLTCDQNGNGNWQPAPSGGSDNDWLFLGNDLAANVIGNVGIGIVNPSAKLHVLGTSRFEVTPGQWIEASTPQGSPGFIASAPNSHRRDIRFDDQGLRLLVGDSSSAPSDSSGLVIDELGLVGIGTANPTTLLDVSGITRSDELWLGIRQGFGPRMILGGDGILGGLLFVRNADTINYGVSIRGGIRGGGGSVTVSNQGGTNTVELYGEQSYGGRVAVGNGAGDTGFIDGNVGGGAQLRLTNDNWDTTFSVTGQAYSSGSQTRMYDSSGTLRHEWTAGNSEWKSFDSSGNLRIQSSGAGAGGTMTYYQSSGQGGVRVSGDYINLGGRIQIYDSSGTESATILGEDSSGGSRVIAGTFEVNNGSDLSESFDINGDTEVEPGMVVCIDPDDVGRLIESREPYQHTVAGIVSGAGGIKPGMLMGQQGSVADGKHPVALTGRVWTWCDASSAPIEPGDLLTTSATPGHAMKVTDHERSNGAILGKAMSSLRSGRGMVLVLVGLQ